MRGRTAVLTTAMAVAVLIAGAAASYAGDATVYVVHGIPNVPVDIAVDGACAIEGFMFGDQVGPISLSPGTHVIKISLADAMDPCAGGVVLEAPVPFMDDENATIIAYLSGMGTPTAGKFPNDFSRPDPGTARIIAHHCAAAPPADIAVSRSPTAAFEPTVAGIANGEQVVEYFRPGAWSVAVAQAGMYEPLLGPVKLRLAPHSIHRLFAVGSPLDGSLTLLHFEH